LILSVNQAFPYTTLTDQLQLNLKEGDSFSYKVKSSKSYLLTYPEDSVLRSIITRSKHTFFVDEKKSGNRYLMRYKTDYEISENWSGSDVSIKDSRFPPFSNSVYDIAKCFRNTVEYKILFSPMENSLQVLNLEEIDKDLMEYLEERGVQVSEYMKKELRLRITDYRIIRRILFINFYPHGGNFPQKWTVDQITEDSENFTFLGENDSTFSILSTRPYTQHSEETGLVLGKSMQILKRIQIHKGTGLLQGAESATYLFPDSTRTDTIYEKRSDITDFRSSVELVDFSRWRKTTTLAGEISNPSAKSLCLVSSSSIVGSDKDYHYIELDNDGRFSETLNLREAKRYQLYYLEKYPARLNPAIQLYVEPGDSIYISTESTSINKNITFTGKGFQNSEFLNDFYYKKEYARYLGSDPRQYFTIFYRKYDNWKDLIEVLPEMSDYLENHKTSLSKGFYDYWKFRILCFSLRTNIIVEYNERATHGRNEYQLQDSIQFLPDTLNPMYKFNSNMEEYNTLVGVHSMSRIRFIGSIYPGIHTMGLNNYDNISFAKMIFSGYPLYVEATRLMEMLLMQNSTQYYLQTPIYQNILRSCNNQEVRDYVIRRYEAYSRIQKGNNMPVMDLIGMDGKKINWRQTKNKVIVLMLYNEYTQEQQFCEDLYTDFGENKKDVIILRISPGIDYDNWKEFNERYSDKDFQMYYTGGESDYNDKFFFLEGLWYAKYLVIGKDGKIFNNSVRLDLKREIKNAQKEEAPPNEFVKAVWTRILPGILLGMILTFIFYRIIYRRRLAKQSLERKIAELEQKAIKAQLNPHFLFNCLNSIQNLIRTDRKSDADRYLTKFAVLIRQVLKNSEKEEISISEELKGLELYLELEQMRFNFDYEILSDEKVDIHNVMIPPMMLHPIVENAILHGLDQKEGDKKLTIGIHESGESIQFLIEDNGVGRDPEPTRDSSDESRGLKLMESRMEILRKSSREDYNFKITDKKDQNGNSAGTCVEILIPDEK